MKVSVKFKFDYVKEWIRAEQKLSKEFDKNMEKMFKGKRVRIRYLNSQNQGYSWEIIEIVVKRIKWPTSTSGYKDVNGPAIYATNGKQYRTHPDYGIILLEET